MDDKKQLYDANEMEQFQTDESEIQYRDDKLVVDGTTTARQHLSRIITPVFGALLLLLMIILLILQGATLYQVRANPESANTADTTTTTSGALTGGDCDCSSNSMEILQQIYNRSQDMVTFNDMLSVYIMNMTENIEDNL